jgi:membrane fusion protein (multidrug efflux system)
VSEAALKIEQPEIEQGVEPSRWEAMFNRQFVLKLVLTLLGSFVAGLVVALSYNWFIFSRLHIETNNAYIEADVFNVQSRMMGYVKSLPVEEDQEVKQNDTLLLLDETDINVEKGFKEAKLKKAKADFDRASTLVKSKLISQSDYELAEAGVIAAQADYRGSQLKLQYTQVLSPSDGVIAKTYVKPGQFIQPGQNLVTVVSKQKFWIKANYKETQIEKIKPGQHAEIEIDAYPGMTFEGQVEGIYPSSGAILSLIPPENATGNFTKVVQRVPVKISIVPKPGYELRPGMSVSTTIHLPSVSP